MHILYIHQHFAIPSGSTATRSYEFAKRWVKAGHQVTLITGRCDICGLKLGKGLIQKQTIEGINVIVVGISYSNKQPFLWRTTSFLCFVLFSIYAALRTRRLDVIYVTSTPLTVGISAMVIKWAKRVPFVFEVRDQWPEIPIELGLIKNKVLIKLLLWLEKTIYRYSSSIVALSPGQADGIRKVIAEDKEIRVIPNGCDTEMFRPDINGSRIREQEDWENKLVFLHAGTMGKVNGLDFIVDGAERLKSNTDIHFVLIGDGSEKPALIRKVHKKGLKNIEILDLVAKTQLPEIFAAIDVGLVIIGHFAIIEHNSANKFFDSLSAGKPVLLNYSGWQREVLEENTAGFGCDLCNLDEFVEKVLYLNSHRAELLEMRRNARRVAVERFDRDNLALEALELVAAAAEQL